MLFGAKHFQIASKTAAFLFLDSAAFAMKTTNPRGGVALICSAHKVLTLGDQTPN